MKKSQRIERVFSLVFVVAVIAIFYLCSPPCESIAQRLSTAQLAGGLCTVIILLLPLAFFWKRLRVGIRRSIDEDQPLSSWLWIALGLTSVSLIVLVGMGAAAMDAVVLRLSLQIEYVNTIYGVLNALIVLVTLYLCFKKPR
jgi:uncharacterized membrane protein YhaH (DUF805 family)